ncbi:putative lipoprotein [Treponema primitia ZAS-2]|uniref:Putative lipoprotein n=1 Tax=Treponema primitia (strain ATCC BAA-887 / DSM 12427 / ZAS-2) TaxID=545694 RepID=F5YKQ7_TREPZ|nr:hypothetical protein [Treponema primitia]AEF84403.1 putative lipoprotein [Treponema primitia ZAS-2]
MKKCVLLIVGALLVLAGCNRAQTGSRESDEALEAFNAIVKANLGRKGYHDALKHWGLSLPGGGKFEWTKDTGANNIDFAMVIPAEPFIRAGLDVTRLDGSGYVFQASKTEGGEVLPDLLLHPYNVSDKKESAQGSEDAFRRILKQKNSLVKYHGDLQHYRLFLFNEGETPFEVQWTEKLGLNDADIIFVIPADPLIRAGLDIARLDSGWFFKEAAGDTGMGASPNQLVEVYSLAN